VIIVRFARFHFGPLLKVPNAVIDDRIAVHIEIVDNIVLFEIEKRFKNLHVIADDIRKIRRNSHFIANN
jgi:hypothetical protein